MYSRIKPLFFLALVIALLAVPNLASAGLHLVIQATGSNQGVIGGDSTVPGYEGGITLTSFQHGVGIAPGQNGVPGSQPSVSELTVSANFDRATVRLMDALPTALALLGLEIPAEVRGASLLPLLDGDVENLELAAYSESFYPRFSFGFSQLRALRHDGWLYLHAPRPELYDLGRDPDQLVDLAPGEPLRVENLRRRLSQLIELAPAAPGREESQAVLEPEEMERLRSLGYLGGGSAAGSSPTEMETFQPRGADPKDEAGSIAMVAEALGLTHAGELKRAEQVLRVVLDQPGRGRVLRSLPPVRCWPGFSLDRVGISRRSSSIGWRSKADIPMARR